MQLYYNTAWYGRRCPGLLATTGAALLLLLLVHVDITYARRGCNRTIGSSRALRIPKISRKTVGKPLTCVWHVVWRGGGDPLVELSLRSFSLGTPLHNNTCEGSYLKVIEGRDPDGDGSVYCGSLNEPQTLLLPSKSLTVIFHSPHFSRTDVFRAQVDLLPRTAALDRHQEMIQEQPGLPVPGTTCDRIYNFCNGACDVVSPGFPGVYPRNTTCTYTIDFDSMRGQVVTFGGQYYEYFDVGGSSWGECSREDRMKTLEVGGRCPNDYLTLYEGAGSGRQLVAAFCGCGRIPPVVLTMSVATLVFTATAEGPAYYGGFALSVGSKDAPEVLPNCLWEANQGAGEIQSPRHWVGRGSACRWVWRGQLGARVWLEFGHGTVVQRERHCRTRLLLYDGLYPRQDSLMATYCEAPPTTPLLSSGPNLLLVLYSEEVSLNGQDFMFNASYSFISNLDLESSCGRTFLGDHFIPPTPISLAPAALLIFGNNSVECTIRLTAGVGERLVLWWEDSAAQSLLLPDDGCPQGPHLNEGCTEAARNSTALLQVLDGTGTPPLCYCSADDLPKTWVSDTPTVVLSFRLHNLSSTLSRKALQQSPFVGVNARYRAVRTNCGQVEQYGSSGRLQYPVLQGELTSLIVGCTWILRPGTEGHVLLKPAHLQLIGDCRTAHLTISFVEKDSPSVTLCQHNITSEVSPWDWVDDDQITSGSPVKVTIRGPANTTQAEIVWTKVLSHHTWDYDISTSVPNPDCYYSCLDQKSCITEEQVCDGIIDCPEARYPGEALDESSSLCLPPAHPSTTLVRALLISAAVVVLACIIVIAVLFRNRHKLVIGSVVPTTANGHVAK